MCVCTSSASQLIAHDSRGACRCCHTWLAAGGPFRQGGGGHVPAVHLTLLSAACCCCLLLLPAAACCCCLLLLLLQHGTHVAGTVGGATYGVAKGVNLVSTPCVVGPQAPSVINLYNLSSLYGMPCLVWENVQLLMPLPCTLAAGPCQRMGGENVTRRQIRHTSMALPTGIEPVETVRWGKP